jgi:hypothetical protein
VSQEWWDSDILLLKKRITERITIEGDLVGILLSYTGLEYSLHTSISYSEPSPHALCAAFAPEVVFRRRNIELKDPRMGRIINPIYSRHYWSEGLACA